MTAATLLAPAASLAMPAKAFFDAAKARLAAGARPLAFWGRPADDPAAFGLYRSGETPSLLAQAPDDWRAAAGVRSCRSMTVLPWSNPSVSAILPS